MQEEQLSCRFPAFFFSNVCMYSNVFHVYANRLNAVIECNTYHLQLTLKHLAAAICWTSAHYCCSLPHPWLHIPGARLTEMNARSVARCAFIWGSVTCAHIWEPLSKATEGTTRMMTNYRNKYRQGTTMTQKGKRREEGEEEGCLSLPWHMLDV